MESHNRTGGMGDLDVCTQETSPEMGSSIEGSEVEQVDAEVEEEAQAVEDKDKGGAKPLAPAKIGSFLPVPSDSPMVLHKTHARVSVGGGGAGDQPPAAMGASAGRDMESLDSVLRENGFMPFNGRVDVDAAQDRLYEVQHQKKPRFLVMFCSVSPSIHFIACLLVISLLHCAPSRSLMPRLSVPGPRAVCETRGLGAGAHCVKGKVKAGGEGSPTESRLPREGRCTASQADRINAAPPRSRA